MTHPSKAGEQEGGAGAALREHLLDLLAGRDAHADFAAAFARVPVDLRGARPAGVEHSLWELLEHLRIAQWDILAFTRDPRHISPAFPDGYWPQGAAPPDEDAWDRALATFARDLEELRDLARDPALDLLAPLPHGQGQTPLREILVAADHNAYHLGQVVALRRLLGAWPPAGS
jgi:uncharacterized damage-inducible protein DinB